MNKMNLFSFIAAITLMLAGCGQALKSEYQRPILSVPETWRIQDTGVGITEFSPHWWDHFGDPLLSQLIASTLQSNNDLALAGIRLRQARLAVGLSDITLTPDFSASGTVSNTKNLRRNTTPSENYDNVFSTSYELDLWGKLARTREQSDWLAKASAQDLQATALTLIGATSQLFWQTASLNQQIVNVQQSLIIARETLTMVTSRFKAGELSLLDVLQAKETVLSREAGLSDLLQQRDESRNALSILLSRPPGQFPAERPSLDIHQSVPVAKRLPLEVIAKRPDVQSAELNLRAALAGSDAARLSFYPSLTLNASLNAGAAMFQQWFSNPARTLGSKLDLPFIQWNKVKLTVEQSSLNVQTAAIQFRNASYKALQDIDNAMSQRLTYQQEKQRQLNTLELSQQRLALVESQYRHGSVVYQTLLDAQNNLLDSENRLLKTQYNYLNSTMKLWLALGGGENNTLNQQG